MNGCHTGPRLPSRSPVIGLATATALTAPRALCASAAAGQPGVGKTCLVYRYLYNTFGETISVRSRAPSERPRPRPAAARAEPGADATRPGWLAGRGAVRGHNASPPRPPAADHRRLVRDEKD